MSTKTRQTTPHVPTQRGKVERDSSTAPPAPPEHADHRVRNITLMVTTAVIALGAVLALWFGVVAGGDDPQAPTSPNNISEGTDDSSNFLRRSQEVPVGPEKPMDGSDQRLYNQAP
jgi:hypothetical protein